MLIATCQRCYNCCQRLLSDSGPFLCSAASALTSSAVFQCTSLTCGSDENCKRRREAADLGVAKNGGVRWAEQLRRFWSKLRKEYDIGTIVFWYSLNKWQDCNYSYAKRQKWCFMVNLIHACSRCSDIVLLPKLHLFFLTCTCTCRLMSWWSRSFKCPYLSSICRCRADSWTSWIWL